MAARPKSALWQQHSERTGSATTLSSYPTAAHRTMRSPTRCLCTTASRVWEWYARQIRCWPCCKPETIYKGGTNVAAEKDRLDPARSCMVFFDTSTYVKNGKFASDDPKDAAMIKAWQGELTLARELKMMIAWPQTAQRPDGSAYFPRRQDIGDDGKPLPIGKRRPISNNVLGAPHIRTIEEI